MLNSFWKTNRPGQIVSGHWTVEEFIIRIKIHGNGLLNGVPLGKLTDHFKEYQYDTTNLEKYRQEYREVCIQVAELVRKSKKIPYTLSYFEESFRIHTAHGPIKSIFFFELNKNHYLLNSVGCVTEVLMWNAEKNKFIKNGQFDSGKVDHWIRVDSADGKSHLISNSAELNTKCRFEGLNDWIFDGLNMSHLKKMGDSGEYSMLHEIKNFPGHFYAFKKLFESVIEFDLDHNEIDRWHLPAVAYENQYRFLPATANLGLALSDGKRLSRLTTSGEPIQLSHLSNTLQQEASKKSKRFFTEKIRRNFENVTENLRLANEKNLKAMWADSPFRNLTILPKENNFNASEPLQLASPFAGVAPIKLNVLPTENRPAAGWSHLFGADKSAQFNNKKIKPDYVPGLDMSDLPTFEHANSSITNDSVVGDFFGTIVHKVEPIADKIIDTVVDLKHKFQHNHHKHHKQEVVGENFQNTSLSDLNTTLTGNNKYRDAFGDLEAKVKPIADDIFDAFAEIQNSGKNLVPNEFEVDLESAARNKSGVDIEGSVDFGDAGDGYLNVTEDIYLDKIDSNLNSTLTKNKTNPVVGGPIAELQDTILPITDDFVDLMSDIDEVENQIAENEEDDDDDDAVESTYSIGSNSTNRNDTDVEFVDSEFGNITMHVAGNTTGNETEDVKGVLKFLIKPLKFAFHEGKELIENIRDEVDKRSKSNSNHHGHHNHYEKDDEDEDEDEDDDDDDDDNIFNLGSIHNITKGDILNSDNSSKIEEFEAKISVPISSNGVATTENEYLPGKGPNEIITLEIGEHRRTLILVTELVEHVVKEKHDFIRVRMN